MADGLPVLSVVVPSVNGWGDLEGCLAALAAQAGVGPLEVLVADRVGDAVRVPLRAGFPAVTLLEAPPDCTIPALRARAIRVARAEAVAVIEDHVIVPPDWAHRMVAALADGADVVGGSVANAATDTLVDRAAFVCEYHGSLHPAPGPATGLTGNNTVYRRGVLWRHRAAWEAGRWEDHLHDVLRAAGVTLVCRPDIVALHRMHYPTARAYAGQRFLYSRAYAAMRLAEAGPARRLVMGLASCALPPVLLWRMLRRVWPSPVHRRVLLGSLPLQALFTVAWAAGEVVGALAGPGDALQRVR